ncbi:hypothetical protein GGX14DRAFT_606068 [Mycena pura]|uniref:Uncharacterized protein n=1 Tax=Mycena pura TaxID=153505 RepID=A0AAD6ULN5_9AGAR|nr:hypothetical protein GGX14DRAFT_606068 [Mycena pura]
MALPVATLIHPDLHLDKLSRLPPDLRRIAKLAAGGSYESLLRLERPVRESPKIRRPLFLPVFFANLDPATIPDPDDLDTNEPSPAVSSTLMRAFVSLQALESYDELAPELYSIFWPRVWQWIEVLDTYHFCLKSKSSSHKTEAGQYANRVHFLQKVLWFRENEQALELIYATYGVWMMVAQLWRYCVKHNLFERGFAGCRVVGRFIGGSITAANVAEIVDALGGTQMDLANLAVKHLQLVSRNPLVATTLLPDVYAVLQFLASAARQGLLLRGPFEAAGLVRTLADTADALRRIPGSDAAHLLQVAWNLILWVATRNVLWSWVPSLLRAGLLRAAVACAGHSVAAQTMDFQRVFTLALPPALVYIRVLQRVGRALREVRTANLHGSTIANEWTAFVALAEERLEVLKFFESQKRVTKGTCSYECL